LLRSTWNYAQNVAAFVAWAERTARVTDLVNDLEAVRWNHDKRYLLELEARGIRIAPTVRVPMGDRRSLAEILEAHGWDDVVVKPSVSAASYRTLRVRPETLTEGEAHLAALVTERDALVQRYLPSVEGPGERALIWVDGDLTHAVRKNPRFGNEDEHVTGAVRIEADERAFAEEVLAALPVPVVYARIDIARGLDDAPVLMEVELIEPSLYFADGPDALSRLTDAIERRLSA
jgi:glutathione synthase/RimK-type ligase-like ATP-grasp enzyme